jgi:hypothetical protein
MFLSRNNLLDGGIQHNTVDLLALNRAEARSQASTPVPGESHALSPALSVAFSGHALKSAQGADARRQSAKELRCSWVARLIPSSLCASSSNALSHFQQVSKTHHKGSTTCPNRVASSRTNRIRQFVVRNVSGHSSRPSFPAPVQHCKQFENECRRTREHLSLHRAPPCLLPKVVGKHSGGRAAGVRVG